MRWKMNKLEYDENPKKYFKKAQEELVVYKIGFATEGDLFKAYDSPERYFAGKVGYDFRHLNKFFFPEGASDMIIGEGHRAYSGECFMELYNDNDDFVGIYTHRDGKVFLYDCLRCDVACIGKFIIPKGTEYYINDDGEIFTPKLIYSGKNILILGENSYNSMCYSPEYTDKPYLLNGKQEIIKLKDICAVK